MNCSAGQPPLQLRYEQVRLPEHWQRCQEHGQQLGLHPKGVELLMARGVTDLDAQRRFLVPKLADLRPPIGMAGFTEAVDLLRSAWKNRWRVGIFGDYDVDGVATTALLTTYLESLGLEVVAQVAHRNHGYGFSVHAAKALLEAGVQLVITGDCGTSDHEAFQWLQSQGIPTAIIDHHQVPQGPLATHALLNPHRKDCEFPFKGLCSAGVAFYLCAALRTAIHRESQYEAADVRPWLDFVALATICDMVPLVAENRILVRHGLDLISRRTRPGIRALLETAGLRHGSSIDEEQISFKLGPRLNAPGRLGAAEPAFLLLRATSDFEAQAMATRVESCNRRRRDLQTAAVASAHALLLAEPNRIGRYGLVVAHHEWHPGLTGVIASNLANHFRRPTIVLAIDKATGHARGSVRTFAGLDIHAALQSCAHLLERFGGHRAAAGLSIQAHYLPQLAQTFDAVMQTQADQQSAFEPFEVYDGTLLLHEISSELMDSIDRLQPFGIGFPAPRYLCEEAQLIDKRELRGGHLALRLRQGQATRDAILFASQKPEGLEITVGRRYACLFRPVRSLFGGKTRIQLHVEMVWSTS